ncbi:hypothetical protein DAEQUDRAFT_724806 [Daedalea quercina L-15889]|uniref:F-box domain-containing protein n=1 Tax=Daedalea quercina L-15889 TaxID=1314783 RepID=A0A165RQQ6_9APHY|nr:hypothetical protein DAEQUDRAFT_724806 [Daedalea quercina L-15889]
MAASSSIARNCASPRDANLSIIGAFLSEDANSAANSEVPFPLVDESGCSYTDGRRGTSPILAVDWHNYYQWGWNTLWDFPHPQSRYGLFPLPVSLSSRIPVEIIEAVIESIDWQSLLCACTLVCRSWHHRSTRALYRSVTINGRAGFQRLSHCAHRYPGVRERLALTREVDIRDSAQAFPLVFGRMLPNLRRLVFAERCMPLPIHRSFFLSLPQLSSVTALTLFALEFYNFAELQRILCKLPRLRILSLLDVELRHARSTMVQSAKLAPPEGIRLHALEVRDVRDWTLNELLDWLAINGATCGLVSELTVYGLSQVNVHRINRLLRLAGASLVDCQLNLLDHIDFRPNVHLRILRVFCDRFHGYEWADLVSTLAIVLQTVQNARLERMELRIHLASWVPNSELPAFLDLSPIHRVQSKEWLARMQEFKICMFVGAGPAVVGGAPAAADNLAQKAIMTAFRTVFAPLQARGILRFSAEVYASGSQPRFASGGSVGTSSEGDLSEAGIDSTPAESLSLFDHRASFAQDSKYVAVRSAV